jgi:hypothetical protein
MDPVSAEASDSLSNIVQSLLPAVNDPVLPPLVTIFPTQVSLVGVGGFVGTNPDPVGDIVGRRVKARVVITAMAKDATSLQSGAAAIARALVADVGGLEQAGILRSRLTDVGPGSEKPQGGGATQFQRDLTFEVTYEFLKLPVAAGDTIKQIPTDVQVG